MKQICNIETFCNISWLRQFFVTFAASIGMFVWGESIGWSSVVNPILRKPESGLGIDDDGSSWIGSTISIGGFIGGLMAGKIMNVLGRKRSLLFVTLISLGGWILLATANHIITICIARFIGGWVAACNGLIAHVYIAEISSSHSRGLFCSFLSLSLAFGITFVIVVGSLVNDWKLITVACMVPVVIGFISLLLVPESPYFLMSKYNDEKSARKSLNWLYNGNDEEIEKVITDIREYQTKKLPKQSSNEKKLEITEKSILDEKTKSDEELIKVSTRISRFLDEIRSIDSVSVWLIFVVAVIMILSRLTGISPLTYYLVEIFQHSSNTFDAFWSAIIVSITEIFGMFLSLFLTDRLGRKLLLLVSALGDVICLCILAWSFDQLGEDSPNLSPIMKYVPMIAMLLFYLFFSVGYGHIPLILLGELFPDNTKALASSIAVAVLWLFDFAVAKLYFLVSNQIGVSGNFYLLSALTFCGFLFVLILVPETKHKTLAEVQEMVKNQKVFLSCDLFQRVKKDDSSV